MDRSGTWSLAPAFDVTYAYQPAGAWTSRHQMTMNGKHEGFALDDFNSCARSASLKRGRARTIVQEVQAVVARWPEYADHVGVRGAQRDKIQNALRLSLD